MELIHFSEAYLIKTYDTGNKFSGSGLVGRNPFIRDEVLTSFASASFQPFNKIKIFMMLGAINDNTGGRLTEPRISQALAFLEAELGDQDYFMGTSPGRPDFMLSWPLDGIVQRNWAELGPKMTAWRERILAREGWKRALAKPGVPYDLTFSS